MRIRSPKDFWAGLMFVTFGLIAMVIALMNYEFGTTLHMGPGYFPVVLGGLLSVLGVVISITGLAIDGPEVPVFRLRPLVLVLASCLAYGYLMQPAGMILATAAMIIISSLGGHEFKWKEVAVLSVGVIAFTVLVFVKGLELPVPLWPEMFH